MLVCALRGEGGGGSEKVYCLYTHENVDIFGWSLSESYDYKWLQVYNGGGGGGGKLPFALPMFCLCS